MDDTRTRVLPRDPSLVTWTHVIYALHATSIIVGVIGSATIVGAFVGGLPSILGVILNYIKRGEVRGSYLESHFDWQIRTFWVALLLAIIAIVLIATIIGVLIGLPMLIVTGFWIVYRVARGWLALNKGEPVGV